LAELARIASAQTDLRVMLQRVADQLHRELDLEFVAIAVVDEERQRFVCEALATRLQTQITVGYTRALGSGVVGTVAAEGKTLLIDDADTFSGFVHTLPGARSELAVPIRFGGSVLAVLNLESTRLRAFERSVELLEAVAAQIAGPIAAINRMAQLNARNAWLETITQTLRAAFEATDIHAVGDRILSALAERLDTIEATLLLQGDLKDHLQVIAHRGASPHITYRDKQWPINKGLVGRAFRSGQEQWLGATDGDPDYIVVNPAVKSELAAPIRFRDETLGVLNLESSDPEAFGQVERLAVRTLCDQAAAGFHFTWMKARLERTTKRVRHQDQMLESTRASLSRAVRKLAKRSDGQQAMDTLEKLVKREARALKRGAREAALWLGARDASTGMGHVSELLSELERRVPTLSGRGQCLSATRVAFVISGIDVQPWIAQLESAAAEIPQIQASASRRLHSASHDVLELLAALEQELRQMPGR
jgi:putative methionine-R-sulfoxide reductase with GAF domain